MNTRNNKSRPPSCSTRPSIFVPSPTKPGFGILYECGSVFPAGVGPDSPSRDAAKWVFSRFSRSVETRPRYGWLRMVFTRCASPELQLGTLLEAGGTVAESLVALKRVSMHQIRRGWRTARSSASEARAEPLGTIIKGANRDVSEGKADL